MAIKKVPLLAFLVVLAAVPAWAQKVKYKDLIELLNTNQFEQAEPHLRRYLKENDDNPSAYMYMGIILQGKALATDMLKETEKAAQFIDSASLFLNKALVGINEKEVKRNEENYLRYRSRDIRTGEFEIKYTEVRFRLEQDVKNMAARKENILKLNTDFNQFRKSYEAAKTQFGKLIAGNPSEKEFYLRADEATEKQLTQIKQKFDSAMVFFESYQATTQQIGKTGYKHVLDKKDVVKYGEDGKRDFNVFNDDLKVWDYGSWADRSASFIKEEVYPLREKFLATDRELVKLRRTIEKDSVSVLKELGEIYPRLNQNPVEQYDANPMPLKVFQMTHAELSYYSKWLENRKVKQSNDLLQKRAAYQSELPFIKRLDSISGFLLSQDIEQEAINYQNYVKTSYGSTLVLKSLISSTHDFATREGERCLAALKKVETSLKWLVVQADSIPLMQPVAAAKPIQPLVVAEEAFTHGMKYAPNGPATGYFYTITPSRTPEVQVTYAIDSAFSNRRNQPLFKGLAATDGKGQLYYTAVFSEARNTGGKFPVTICKIYRTDGLAWQMNFQFDCMPAELQLNATTGELLVRCVANGESRMLVIDKAGKLIQ
jgi:hypothetical protein